jgi:hypothetical protein
MWLLYWFKLAPRQRRARKHVRFRPFLECLEGRAVPAAVYWTGWAGGGNWNNFFNWSTFQVPRSTDDVFITQSNSTVTYSGSNHSQIHSLTDNGQLNITGGTLAIASSSTVQDLVFSGGNLQIDGYVAVPDTFQWYGGTLSGQGELDALTNMYMSGGDSAKTLDSLTLANEGVCNWNGSGIGAANGATFINGPSAFFVASTDFTFAPVIINEGAFEVDPSIDIVNLNVIYNYGTVAIQGGALAATNFVQYGGVTDLGSGGYLTSPNSIQIDGGVFFGPGEVDASLYNAATVDLSAGSLFVTGNYFQTSTGALNVTLDGVPGALPPLTVQGTASLAGTLHVGFSSTFNPHPGDVFQVVQGAACVGQFAVVTGLPVSSTGMAIVPTYTSQAASLTAFMQQQLKQQPTTTPTPAAHGSGSELGSEILAQQTLGATTTSIVVSQPAPTLIVQLVSGNYLGSTALPNQAASLRGPDSVGASGGTSPGKPHEYEAIVVTTAPEELPEPAALDPGGVVITLQDLESPPSEEMLSGSDIAGSLLTGSRPRAEVLPQQGSSVAAVPTLLAGEGSADRIAPATLEDDSEETKSLWISPLGASTPATSNESTTPTPAAESLFAAAVASLSLRHRTRDRQIAPVRRPRRWIAS